MSPFVIIDAGHRGVIFNAGSGVEDKVLAEGFHWRTPFIQTIKEVDVKVQRSETIAGVGTKDLQYAQIKAVVNWHLDPNAVNRVYQDIGDLPTVLTSILKPRIAESIKAKASGFTAEQLLTLRSDLKAQIEVDLRDSLIKYNIILDDIAIEDIDFSEGFDQAIERKAQAEQDALTEGHKLDQVKRQAEQQIEIARAEAESIRIKAEALAQNKELVQLNAVEKWDGKLPVNLYGSAPIPFLNIAQ